MRCSMGGTSGLMFSRGLVRRQMSLIRLRYSRFGICRRISEHFNSPFPVVISDIFASLTVCYIRQATEPLFEGAV
jgi:hypothetical protein